MVYIGLPRYTEAEWGKLLDLRPDGVVLGDLLCNKRMFPHGGAELGELMLELKAEGISAIYQTPLYATDRVFSDVVEAVAYYHKKGLIRAAIVQDVGVASVLSRRCEGLTIIWGRLGYARTPTVNTHTIDFYMEHGVTGFECKSPEQADYAGKIGASPYLMIGYPRYLTINRECYYRFEHNIFDDHCQLGCLNREKIVIPTGKGIETTLDGYVLGWQNVYDPECMAKAYSYANCIVYADSLPEAAEKIDEMNRLAGMVKENDR